MLGKFLHPNFSQSYMLQMRTIHSLKCKSVLEIGAGEGFTRRNLKTLGYKYHICDVIDTFEPDYRCSLEDLKVTEDYEIVCAFQMLEHIPYEDFLRGLKKMSSIASKYVVISVPYNCKGTTVIKKRWSGQFQLVENTKVDRYKSLNLPDRTDGPKGGHYWEIGRGGKTVEGVTQDIQRQELRVLKQFHSLVPYHYFFVMEVL
jgi:hypothetical protein